MAPATKRARPSFSPPRPGKSKAARGASTTKKSGTGAGVSGTKVRKTPATTAPHSRSRKRKSGSGATMRAILDDASSGDDDNDDDNDDDDANDDSDDHDDHDDEDADRAEPETHDDTTPPASSPEPDLMLAEITAAAPAPSHRRGEGDQADAAIPPKLLHRIMQEVWDSNTVGDGPQTVPGLSTDARHLVSVYVDTFVREAVRRCVEERRERGDAGGGAATDADTGWLEVEDLERIGVQLCLDF